MPTYAVGNGPRFLLELTRYESLERPEWICVSKGSILLQSQISLLATFIFRDSGLWLTGRGLAGIAPCDECRNEKLVGCAAEGQRGTFRRRDNAARGGNQCVAGGHVPLAGRREPRIDVGGTFRDLAELDGRAGRYLMKTHLPPSIQCRLRGAVYAAREAKSVQTVTINGRKLHR